MKQSIRAILIILIAFFLCTFLSGCTISKFNSPKLIMKPANGPDDSGAMKYQMWTGYIHVAPLVTKEVEKPGDKAKIELKGAVARNPYKPVILFKGEDKFLSTTTLTYAPIKDTKMPEKITIAVEDKTEKRIEQAGTILKAVLPLALLSAPTKDEIQKAKDHSTDFEKAIASFKPWVINITPALDSDKLKEEEITLTAKDGIGANPEGWEYTLAIGNVSNTAIDIGSKSAKEMTDFLDSLGSNGVIIHPSSRTAILTLTHINSGEKWIQSFNIPDPKRVETAQLPIKGSMIFHNCSVAVEPGDYDQRDYMDLAVKLSETAKSVWEEYKNKAEEAKK